MVGQAWVGPSSPCPTPGGGRGGGGGGGSWPRPGKNREQVSKQSRPKCRGRWGGSDAAVTGRRASSRCGHGECSLRRGPRVVTHLHRRERGSAGRGQPGHARRWELGGAQVLGKERAQGLGWPRVGSGVRHTQRSRRGSGGLHWAWELGFTPAVKGKYWRTWKRQFAVMCDLERPCWLLQGEWGAAGRPGEPLRGAGVPGERQLGL